MNVSQVNGKEENGEKKDDTSHKRGRSSEMAEDPLGDMPPAKRQKIGVKANNHSLPNENIHENDKEKEKEQAEKTPELPLDVK